MLSQSSTIGLKYVRGAGIRGSLGGRRLIYTHVPKAAGTTLDRILSSIAKYRGERWMRVSGTIYGQFFGAGKPTAESTLRGIDPDALRSASIVSGHLPTTLWDEYLENDRAAFFTILREPVERMLSHYRFGVARGGWSVEASLLDLTKEGMIVDNQQVRQLSGCQDPSVPISDVMLRAAMEILEQRYALVGASDCFDAFLGTLISLCGWPHIVYSRYQVGRTEIDESRMEALREESRALNQQDSTLFEEVKRLGKVWINKVDESHSPAPEDSVIVVSPFVRPKGRGVVSFPRSQLTEFAKSIRQSGARLRA